MEYKTYNKLDKYQTYDKEAAEELATALNELVELKARTAFLEDLIAESSDLSPFVWTTLEGKTIALHDIDDDHLKNILAHLARNGRTIGKAIQAEATRRGFTIPTAQHKHEQTLLPAMDVDWLLADDE